MFSKESLFFLIAIWSLFLIWELNINFSIVETPEIRYDLLVLPGLVLTTAYVISRHLKQQ